MGRQMAEYLVTKTDTDPYPGMAQVTFYSDMNELKMAAKLGGLGVGTSVFKWVASFAAIYLLILDRTNWRTNMQTSLLVPYIFFSLPSPMFAFLRGEFGKWVAFIAVVLRLFFPRHFPEWLEIPGSLILLLVVSPGFFAVNVRNSWPAVAACVGIACYLLQEHIRASGGFRNSFTQRHGISNTLGIILLLAYPVWALLVHVLETPPPRHTHM
ncbi:hypothetical protein NMG60_11008058 [Bertholletia excelsa]